MSVMFIQDLYAPPIGLIRNNWKLAFSEMLTITFPPPPIGLIRNNWKRTEKLRQRGCAAAPHRLG